MRAAKKQKTQSERRADEAQRVAKLPPAEIVIDALEQDGLITAAMAASLDLRIWVGLVSKTRVGLGTHPPP